MSLGREKQHPRRPQGSDSLLSVACWCHSLAEAWRGNRKEACRPQNPPLPKNFCPEQHRGVRSQKEEAQSLWPLTLSLERRLQEDMTVCFLGLPLGLLPLFRFCTSFSCSLETQHQSALRSPTCKPFSGFSLHPPLPRDPCCSSLQ